MTDRPNYITPSGYRALREEYEALFGSERDPSPIGRRNSKLTEPDSQFRAHRLIQLPLAKLRRDPGRSQKVGRLFFYRVFG